MVKLEFSLEDVSLIMSALASMPYKDVAALIHKIDKCAREQISAPKSGE